MDILIFDMDGVLLRPYGYHRALKETVRLAGISTGIGEVLLTDEQIAMFEALGISSEWHSSAMCMAFMTLQIKEKVVEENNPSRPVTLNLDGLFEAIAGQSIQESALKRGVAAIERLAIKYGLTVDLARELVANSESIQHSPTMNWFQELILGSPGYKNTYNKPSRFETESYLTLYDRRILNESLAEEIIRWADQPGNGAAIMTNRPSRSPFVFRGAPDADLGISMVGLEGLPLVGYGEISWLAEKTHRDIGGLSKPSWVHALVAILMASGWSLEKSLAYARQSLTSQKLDGINHLQYCTITVFEDTPGGIVAVQEVGNILNEKGLGIEVQKIGIAEDSIKQSALSAQDAVIFPDINMALASLDNFRAFSGN